ncbi:radical SAM protein [Porticoccus sp.]|uniref:radical SAM protein n=1 Tax=Porticoccus sp. TaxID=2024853 RepID=UPI000C503A5A|nr:radical SAM protein [Porticoccus sp.]MAZ70269.1 radical SAM protein [Porticoccus sp.]|tara:strand:+ start:70725 stop:71606 length:882 start_codon:yes stop_codon:yes gene_type:complete
MNYVEPLFRPPSEARSLILQVTNGCSWNRCTFCEMYTAPQKKFSVKPQSEIEQELQQVASSGYPVRRVFLADGDAMTLSFRRLRELLLAIRQYLPDVQRISSYCLPSNMKNKSVDELAELQQLGLSLMYVGCESGDDLVLEKIDKGENYASSLDALHKIKQAGMKSSVMILNGLGGQQYTEQHAINSAKLMNEAQPEFLSTLVVSFPGGIERFQQGFGGEFQPLTQQQLFQEMEILLDTLELERTVFRSDHASNYLVLKGTLNRDKAQLLQQVRTAIQRPGVIPLREEWQRGL